MRERVEDVGKVTEVNGRVLLVLLRSFDCSRKHLEMLLNPVDARKKALLLTEDPVKARNHSISRDVLTVFQPVGIFSFQTASNTMSRSFAEPFEASGIVKLDSISTLFIAHFNLPVISPFFGNGQSR